MLYIHFGLRDNTVFQFDIIFKHALTDPWFKHPLLQQIVKDIDKSEVIDGPIIKSPIFGLMPTQRLSSGTKALALMLFRPEKEYYATCMGDNCGKWIVEISKLHDVHIALDRIMEFFPPDQKDESLLNAINVNTGQHIYTMCDFVDNYVEWRAHGRRL